MKTSIYSCSSDSKKNGFIFSGSITNKTTDTISIYSNDDRVLFNIALKNEKFADTLFIDEGYYYIGYDEAEIQIYVESGFNLELSFDYDNLEESLKFNGIGSNENNYLFEKLV